MPAARSRQGTRSILAEIASILGGVVILLSLIVTFLKRIELGPATAGMLASYVVASACLVIAFVLLIRRNAEGKPLRLRRNEIVAAGLLVSGWAMLGLTILLVYVGASQAFRPSMSTVFIYDNSLPESDRGMQWVAFSAPAGAHVTLLLSSDVQYISTPAFDAQPPQYEIYVDSRPVMAPGSDRPELLPISGNATSVDISDYLGESALANDDHSLSIVPAIVDGKAHIVIHCSLSVRAQS